MEDKQKDLTLAPGGEIEAPAVSGSGPEITPEDLEPFTLWDLPIVASPFVPEGKIYVNSADLQKTGRRPAGGCPNCGRSGPEYNPASGWCICGFDKLVNEPGKHRRRADGTIEALQTEIGPRPRHK